MKKLISLALCLATCFAMYANTLNEGNLKATTTVVESKTIHLQVVNLQQEKAYITLSDADDDVTFYAKTVKNHNGFTENINLAALPSGRYVIEVRTKAKTIKQVVRVNEYGVLFSDFR